MPFLTSTMNNNNRKTNNDKHIINCILQLYIKVNINI